MRTEVACCVCGKHLRRIDTPSGGTSHGYCQKHFEEAMQKVERELGPQEPPNDPMVYNRRQADGTFRPLTDFWERDDALPAGE